MNEETEETIKCTECGKEPETNTEKRLIEQEGKCYKCTIEKTEEETRNRIKTCVDCLRKTYPTNTFKHEDGYRCNECTIAKEAKERKEELKIPNKCQYRNVWKQQERECTIPTDGNNYHKIEGKCYCEIHARKITTNW